MANPVSEFINRVQCMDGTELGADASAYSVALASVLEAAGDQQQLDRHRRALANLSAWLLDADGEESPRVPPIQTLLQVVEALQQAAPGDPDLDVHALAAMVRGKAHAEPVLNALLHGPLPPKDILTALKLEAAQLHRVLRWAMSVGLVERSGLSRDVVYSISRIGETALRGVDEPAWVQTAALLLQLAVEARLRRWPTERARQEAAELSGLRPAEVERTLAAMESALGPSVSSALAAALGCAHSRAEVLVEPDSGAQGRATALVSRALERAGIDDGSVRWWTPTATIGVPALARTALCIGTPYRGKLGAAVLEAFGSVVEFRPGTLHLRLGGSARGETWHSGGGVEYAVVARLYSPTTGSSHFVVGGLGNEGTVAAARTFYEHIEALLDERPDTSFAAVVRAREDESEVLSVHTLHTVDPYAPGDPIRRTKASEPVVDADSLLHRLTESVRSTAMELAAAATEQALSTIHGHVKGRRKASAERRVVERKPVRARTGRLRGDEARGEALPLPAREQTPAVAFAHAGATPTGAWVGHAER